MYYNVVYVDLMIKGLVRVFLSPLKKKKKAFVVMQMRHTRLRRLTLPEQVVMIIFCTVVVLFLSAAPLSCSAR